MNQEEAPKRKLLILSELYYPEDISTGYFLTGIAEELGRDFNVTVVTGPPTKNFQKTTAPSKEIRAGVKIIRCSGTCFNKNRTFGRAINALSRSISMFVTSFRLADSATVLIVVTNPPILPWLAAGLSYLRGSPLLILLQDIYPEILVVTKLCREDSWSVKLFDSLNKRLMLRATKFIALGRDMRAYLLKKFSRLEADQVKMITNWADERIQPLPEPERYKLRAELGIEDKFVVLLTGNLGRTHGVECFAEVAKAMRDLPRFHFLVMGQGAKKSWLENFLKNNQLSNMTLLPPCDWSELNFKLNLSDIAVIPFLKKMAGLSVPSRLYNHMAVGKPVIGMADPESELGLTITEAKIGWVLEPDNEIALVNTLREAESNPTLCKQMGQRSADTASTKYSKHVVTRAYVELLNETFGLRDRA